MALMTRKFGQKKPASAAAPSARIAQAVSTQQATPRPLRGTSYREASVVYESGYSRRCIVLDYSHTGVRLRFPTNEILPPQVVVQAGAVGVVGPARVIWQENSEVGLALI